MRAQRASAPKKPSRVGGECTKRIKASNFAKQRPSSFRGTREELAKEAAAGALQAESKPKSLLRSMHTQLVKSSLMLEEEPAQKKATLKVQGVLSRSHSERIDENDESLLQIGSSSDDESFLTEL